MVPISSIKVVTFGCLWDTVMVSRAWGDSAGHRVGSNLILMFAQPAAILCKEAASQVGQDCIHVTAICVVFHDCTSVVVVLYLCCIFGVSLLYCISVSALFATLLYLCICVKN